MAVRVLHIGWVFRQEIPMAIEIQGLTPLLSVFDMPRALAFYRDMLGCSAIQTSPPLSSNPDHVNWVMLRLGDATFMLNTAYDPENQPAAPEPARFAGHRDTTLYFACLNVDGAYRDLQERGLEIAPPSIAPYGMKQLYLNDPDENGLCFQWPASAKPESQE
jgi:uncharacterized glyoxalase superfamily protein PhnB